MRAVGWSEELAAGEREGACRSASCGVWAGGATVAWEFERPEGGRLSSWVGGSLGLEASSCGSTGRPAVGKGSFVWLAAALCSGEFGRSGQSNGVAAAAGVLWAYCWAAEASGNGCGMRRERLYCWRQGELGGGDLQLKGRASGVSSRAR
ncbi:uncharacterized protein A4U43_C04F23670 [Asparagus officinalis]|uniref:Uncharacterized protein n=1 Tax=Asparagus officinalis TaxID=4686 RepID=A0A5P1F8J3_ASPOF|nr:uncharacterized protein A4U43_C04F23670 [Asparagus officinalis]